MPVAQGYVFGLILSQKGPTEICLKVSHYEMWAF